MALAPVIAFDRARRIAMARQLREMGVPLERITATQTDAELADLWTRERTLHNLGRLTGHPRAMFTLWDTADLAELEKRILGNLMGSDGRGADRLIYSISGRAAGTRSERRRQQNRAWGIPA